MSSSNAAAQVGAGPRHVTAITADLLDDFIIGKADHWSATYLRQGE